MLSVLIRIAQDVCFRGWTHSVRTVGEKKTIWNYIRRGHLASCRGTVNSFLLPSDHISLVVKGVFTFTTVNEMNLPETELSEQENDEPQLPHAPLPYCLDSWCRPAAVCKQTNNNTSEMSQVLSKWSGIEKIQHTDLIWIKCVQTETLSYFLLLACVLLLLAIVWLLCS